ncbi:hypothetical protein BJX65DRAFT_41320 [Aspergillus insuetus]
MQNKHHAIQVLHRSALSATPSGNRHPSPSPPPTERDEIGFNLTTLPRTRFWQIPATSHCGLEAEPGFNPIIPAEIPPATQLFQGPRQYIHVTTLPYHREHTSTHILSNDNSSNNGGRRRSCHFSRGWLVTLSGRREGCSVVISSGVPSLEVCVCFSSIFGRGFVSDSPSSGSFFPFAVRRPDKQCFASFDGWLGRLFVPLFDLPYSLVGANMCSPLLEIFIADT